MNERNNVFKRLAGMLDMSSQPMPGMPIIEMAGNKRVLIENHRGVIGYGQERIGVLVKIGKIVVMGSDLEICYMSRQQLIITGCIESVSIERGCD